MRNKIVATDFMIARRGFGKVPSAAHAGDRQHGGTRRHVLPHVAAAPQIMEVTEPLKSLQPLEREYFTAMMTFVYREQLMAKTGSQEGVSRCTADLWNMPLAEKIETGNIYTGLRITAKESSAEGRAPDLLTLAVPEQGGQFPAKLPPRRLGLPLPVPRRGRT